MKFAVWGAGQKGKIILSVMGQELISCFIDSNVFLHGTNVQGIPVISFEEYLKDYTNSVIIISMLDCQAVIEKLFYENVPYIMWESSSGILESDFTKLEDFLELVSRFVDDRNIAIWGVNTLSISLYDYVKKRCANVSFINNEVNECLRKLLEKKGYRFDERQAERIIVTDNGWQKAVLRYPNKKIIDINNLFLDRTSIEYRELARFKNKHKQKRCFIIGNGPSLRVEDLDMLNRNGEICFATNMIYKVLSKTEWRPQYYVVSDMAVLKKYGDQIKQLQLPCLFIGNRRTGFWEGFENPRYHAFNDFRCLDMDIPYFSEDITRCIYSYYTVTYTCLQIAIYMGFEEIYLLGVDANYSGYASDDNNHFIKDYYDSGDKQRIPVELEKHFRAYQVAKNWAEKHDIKIFNATRGGGLEVFERVDIEKLCRI